MKQYHQLLRDIKERGTYKAPARENMPGTLSLFGYQNRYNLQDGFPILTTKKVNFKHIVTELLWFLRGDTNIKYLIDNGCNIWNEDAYNYYVKIASKNLGKDANYIYHHNGNGTVRMYTFEEFVEVVKEETYEEAKKVSSYRDYVLGDCGKQYGWLWRNWRTEWYQLAEEEGYIPKHANNAKIEIDQIQDLINGLKSNPTGRRHIITAWNPATLNDMALNACHAFVQFNCRPIYGQQNDKIPDTEIKYYLDCQMYQRSADVFLGVPYNIASYALLTHIIAKICNMEVGDLIHTFGDVHIYDNHLEAVDEILTRTPTELPKLIFEEGDEFWKEDALDKLLNALDVGDFTLENYNPQASIKAKLSTGLIK